MVKQIKPDVQKQAVENDINAKTYVPKPEGKLVNSVNATPVNVQSPGAAYYNSLQTVPFFVKFSQPKSSILSKRSNPFVNSVTISNSSHKKVEAKTPEKSKSPSQTRKSERLSKQKSQN